GAGAPYTTLFRSGCREDARNPVDRVAVVTEGSTMERFSKKVASSAFPDANGSMARLPREGARASFRDFARGSTNTPPALVCVLVLHCDSFSLIIPLDRASRFRPVRLSSVTGISCGLQPPFRDVGAATPEHRTTGRHDDGAHQPPHHHRRSLLPAA